MTSFSKWLPGDHIRFFSFWMGWFRQRNSSLLWNFSFKFHVHVFCGCRQKPGNCQLCRFQNGCLLILNNVQLQSAHCPLPPSPMGRGYPNRSLIYNFYFCCCFWWFHNLMPYNIIMLHFRLPYFHVSNSALFSNTTSVLSFHKDVVLSLSIEYLIA